MSTLMVSRKVKSFLITAKDFKVELMAVDSSSAINSFQELFPQHKQFQVCLTPDWNDSDF
jgi:hypothetical protein